MIDVTVKTLDSQNHKYSVPDDVTVRQFKDKVATSVGIPADKQRLIYCGRVLQDDKKLSEYDVNGKVIHLVQRPPPPSATRPSTSANGSSASAQPTTGVGGNTQPHAHRPGGSAQDGSSFLLGAFTIPSDVMDPNQVQQIVHQVVSGMGDFGRNATIMSRTSDDGSTVDVHINLGQVPLMGESGQRITNARNMIRRANACLNRLENASSNRTSPTTEEASGEESGAASGTATTAGSSEAADAEVEDAPVDGFVEGLAVAGIIEGEIFIRPAMAMPGAAGGDFPVITDAARLAATTALAAAATTPMAELPQQQTTTAPPTSGLIHGGSARPQSGGNGGDAAANGGSTTSQADNQQRRANGQQPQQRVTQPTLAPVLATLMGELGALQSRLQPYLEQYQTILQEDRDLQGNAAEQTRLQRTFDLVSEATHFISHAYHTVSDIMVNMSQTPPRNLRSRSVVVQQPTLMQAGIPLQAQINIGSLNAAAAMHAAAVAAAANQNQAAGSTATMAGTDNGSAAPEGSSTANTAAPSAPVGGDAGPNVEHETQQHTANIPLGIGIPAQMAGFFQSPNPVVFMEVGPGSITASVVSETIAGQPVQLTGPQFANQASQQVPPQDLIRNLMQAVGQATTLRNGTNGQSQARGNTATQPTTSTQTRSTSRPIQTIPIAFPGIGIPSFDPYLPCSSHHVAHLRRPGIPLRLAPQPQGNGTANAPTDTQLAGIIANLMSALFSNPATVPGTNGGAMAANTSAVGGPSSSRNGAGAAGTAGAAGRGGMEQLGRVRRMLSELLTMRRNVGDQSQNSTIADFLQTLPDYSYQEGEGLISDLVMTMARRLSLREFVEVLFGRSEILNRLRVHLQEFVRGRVLNDAPPSNDNVQAAVSRLATSMVDVLRLSVQDIEIREGVNYFATLRNFLEDQLLSLIRIILSTREEDFGATLYTACRQIICEEVVLHVYCFRAGQRALERMVQNTVRQIAVDLDQFILQWMQQMCTVQIRAMIPNITVREADILRYVVRDVSAGGAAAAASPSGPAQPVQADASNAPAPSTTASGTSSSQAPMESTTSLPEFAKVDRKGKKAPIVAPLVPSAPTEAEMADAVPITVPMDTSEPNLPPAGGAWQGAVPLDWVPIIGEDVQRQRRQSAQRPFSDAYVATMPSKRRKMMNGEKLQTVVDGGVLQDTLQRAISAVGAQPTTSLDAVLSDVAANTTLNAAFQDHLGNSVSSRLNADKDFSPQKFPNADIVFRCQRPDGEP